MSSERNNTSSRESISFPDPFGAGKVVGAAGTSVVSVTLSVLCVEMAFLLFLLVISPELLAIGLGNILVAGGLSFRNHVFFNMGVAPAKKTDS